MKIKKFNKKEKNPNIDFFSSLSKTISDIICDLDTNVFFKSSFGFAPIEIANLILERHNRL